MRAPTVQFGKFRIRYRQIPYMERFFFVDVKSTYGSQWNKEIMKIKPSCIGFHCISINSCFSFVTLAEADRLNKFMDKVDEYDKYLDGKD